MSTRYTIIGTLAAGGMGTVFLARSAGSAGFSRLVAIKRLLPELAAQREFIAMLVDEARLASQVRHVNVIDTLDLVASDGAFSLILEYVEGAAISVMTRGAAQAGERVPQPIAIAIIQGVLRGLDAAHEARGTEGQPLGIVHRDISPQNVLVGVDGVPRIIDFGIAKAMGRVASTRPGEVRGKFAYMAPEQLLERPATRQADVYAAGVVLWELLTGERLFVADDQRAVAAAVMRGDIKAPSTVNPEISPELDAVVKQATARELSDRFLTARDFLDALAPFKRASDDEVGFYLRSVAGEYLGKRSLMLQNVAAEQSRSVEDLMAELAASATPASAKLPPLQIPPESYPELASMPSAPGMTSAGMALAAGAPPNGPRSWILIPAVCAIAFLLAAALVVGLSGLKKKPPPQFTTAPPLPADTSIAAPPSAEPPATAAPSLAVPSPIDTSPIEILSAAPPPSSGPRQHTPWKRPPKHRDPNGFAPVP